MITRLLIALNIIIYVLMVFSGVHFFEPTTQQILQWGGCSTSTLLQGEPWRLLTAMFVHFGIIHLLMNLYALYDIGSTLETLIGKARFAAVYLATGIFGGLLSQIWHLDSYSVEAGASGGVFGVIGALVALLTTPLLPEEVRNPPLKRVLGLIAVNLFYGMKSSVNVAAHLGGLLSGIVIGYCLYITLIHNRNKIKQAALVGISLIILVSASGTLKYMKGSDFFKFEEIATEIHAMQDKMDTLYEGVPTTQFEFLDYYQKNIIPAWDRGILLADQVSQLNLTGDKANYRDYLVKWVSLHSKKYQLFAEQVKADAYIHALEIKKIDDEIASLAP